MPARPSTVAPPPISFFISFMPGAGLTSRPPLSKHTPLPTSVTFGTVRIAPGEVDQARRIRGGPANGMDSGVILLQQIFAHCDADLSPVSFGDSLGGGGQIARLHVFGRRVDQVPREIDRFDRRDQAFAVDTARQAEDRTPFPLCGLVPVEPIGAEHPSQRGLRRIGAGLEHIIRRRQLLRQRRDAPEVGSFPVAAAEDAAHLAVGTGDRTERAGFRLESRRLYPGADFPVTARRARSSTLFRRTRKWAPHPWRLPARSA